MTVDGAASAGGNSLSAITRRERMILALLNDGMSNAEIGRQLGIAEPTVRRHLTNIYKKLGVENRIEAILRARLLRIVG
jgi:ATP/maltotriose-dependent transcriptional regulator MalT